MSWSEYNLEPYLQLYPAKVLQLLTAEKYAAHTTLLLEHKAEEINL